MNEAFKKQAGLLLDVLPEVAREECFAMHGGTAINLFVRNMPRLSIDIDLIYVDIAERREMLDGIKAALVRIKERIERLRSSIRVQHKESVYYKLQLDEYGASIKIEVNVVSFGLLGDAVKAPLCEAAQGQFDAFCVTPLVPLGQLYGGKLCAAMDRQHPRDLFDVKPLLDNEGLSDEIKKGFLFKLVSSNRPTHEILKPNLHDQRMAFENQFKGMSNIEFSYADYEATRLQLIKTINANLDDVDKGFLLSLNRLAPDWSVYDFKEFPSVKWKLLNLEKFKREKHDDYLAQLARLEGLLEQ